MATAKKIETEQPSLFSNSFLRIAEKKQEEVKKNGFYQVPWDRLEIEPDFNDREDYGTAEDLDELAESIFQSGVMVPLKGRRNGEKFVIVVGHRRHRAGEIILKKYGKLIVYPMILYPPTATKQDMLLDTLLSNSGKELTPLEKASAVGKLLIEKVSTKEIARALGGVSEVYVKNLSMLSAAPEKAKKLIRAGSVSATFIISKLREKKGDFAAFLDNIEELAKDAKKEGKQAAITKKKAEREHTESRAASSWGEFKRFRKTGNDIFESEEKQKFFEFLSSMADNQLSYGEILEFFTGKNE